MPSALWVAQDRLYAALKDNLGVPVSLGFPPKMSPTHVWISGGVSEWTQEYRLTGLAAKHEEFVFSIHTLVTSTSPSYEAIRDMARDITDDIEDIVSSDAFLSGEVRLAQVVRGELEEALLEEGRKRQVGVRLDVRIETWLS